MKNKILTLLLSLVISFGLWLYVVTVVSPETESVIENISEEIVAESEMEEGKYLYLNPKCKICKEVESDN